MPHERYPNIVYNWVHGADMRILILHSRYLSGWASGENSVVRDEARSLTEAGHEVATWTPAPGPLASANVQSN